MAMRKMVLTLHVKSHVHLWVGPESKMRMISFTSNSLRDASCAAQQVMAIQRGLA